MFWLIVLILWLVSIAAWQRPLFHLLFFSTLNSLQRISLLATFAWIDFAWLCALYQTALSLTGSLFYNRSVVPAAEITTSPAVAILYTTMNDFNALALESCVNQQYPGDFHVYVLDDSTDPIYQRKVDTFSSHFSTTTTVVRRSSRRGFKAGNLNHALAAIAPHFRFFSVCDADGILPRNFLSRTVALFTDDRIGFVQALQRSTSLPRERSFAADLGVGVEIYWRRIVTPLERFGFLMFHGHGATIRTRVWREIGGFPEIVCEDLGFSTRAREKGYFGLLAHDVVCEEDFPETYSLFARRHLKYVRGAVQHFGDGMWSFLCSGNVPWFERLDRLFASIALVSGVPLLLFIVNVVFLVPLVFGYDWLASPTITMASRTDSHKIGFHAALYVMVAATLVAPLIPAALHLWNTPRRLTKYIVLSIAVHISLLAREACEVLQSLFSQRITFTPTGDHSSNEASDSRVREPGTWQFDFSALAIIAVVECLRRTSGPTLLPLFIAVIVRILVARFGWQHKATQIALPLPAVAIAILLALHSLSLLGLCGSLVPAALAGLYYYG
jgi:hypothetical protein